MAKRESIWKANDGSEHRSKQSAAVADAEHEVFNLISDVYVYEPGGAETAANMSRRAEDVIAAFGALVKARAALAKHEGRDQ